MPRPAPRFSCLPFFFWFAPPEAIKIKRPLRWSLWQCSVFAIPLTAAGNDVTHGLATVSEKLASCSVSWVSIFPLSLFRRFT
jgi:hypothetical protein